MMELPEIEARLEIQALHGLYIKHVDSGRAERLATLFTEECEYDMDGGVVATKSADIVAEVEKLKAGFNAAENFGRIRHHMSSTSIEIEGPSEAKAMSYFLAVSALGPDHWGTYRDQIVRTDQGWRFAKRVVRVGGAVESSPVRSFFFGQG